MNEYKYNELSVGMGGGFEVIISEEHQNLFRFISGDINPLHQNIDFAKGKGFSNIVVFGMLTASFYSKLVGVYLPGKYCLFQSIDTKFLKPVYIGDRLSVSGIIKEKHDKFKQVIISAVIKNQNDEKVSKAIINVGVLDE